MKKIVKITAEYFGRPLTWSRENIGDMIDLIPEKIKREKGNYSKVKIIRSKYDCDECQDFGYIEIMGDGDNFENDVVGTRPCRDCAYED